MIVFKFLAKPLLIILIIALMSGIGFLVYWFLFGVDKFYHENVNDPKAKYWRY